MKDFKIYISIATILLIVYLVAQYNKPSPLNWQATLYYNDKIPFGTYVMHRELPRFFPNAEVTKTNQTLYDLLHNQTVTNSNYFIITKTINLSKYDFKEMVNYIEAGNSVFITAFNWQGVLADTLELGVYKEYKKTKVGINFTNKQLKQPKDYYFDRDITSSYFTSFDTAHATVLGKNELGNSNFLRFSYGKGNLYLCANPLLFTNYSLLTKNGADYASKALSYLPPQTNIYWDEFQNGDIMEDESPFRVFFNHTSLQWAYYITLFSLVLFVLYEMKRRQRIIPVVEPLKNSTVDFAKVVGQVYYEQRNNKNLAEKKILFFLEHLRTRYYVKTNNLNAEFIESLSYKTGVDTSLAQEIVNHINYIRVQKQINDHELITLNQLIEKFYKQSE